MGEERRPHCAKPSCAGPAPRQSTMYPSACTRRSAACSTWRSKVPEIFALAGRGDRMAVKLVERQGREIGILAGSLLERLDLQHADVPVVLGGGIPTSGDALLLHAEARLVAWKNVRRELGWSMWQRPDRGRHSTCGRLGEGHGRVTVAAGTIQAADAGAGRRSSEATRRTKPRTRRARARTHPRRRVVRCLRTHLDDRAPGCCRNDPGVGVLHHEHVRTGGPEKQACPQIDVRCGLRVRDLVSAHEGREEWSYPDRRKDRLKDCSWSIRRHAHGHHLGQPRYEGDGARHRPKPSGDAPQCDLVQQPLGADNFCRRQVGHEQLHRVTRGHALSCTLGATDRGRFRTRGTALAPLRPRRVRYPPGHRHSRRSPPGFASSGA